MSIFSYILNGDYFTAILFVLSRTFVVFCCLPIHELAHGWMAYKLGDTTAKDSGRLSFNPLAHLNPIGTIMIFLFGIGYANPVPVNPNRFKDPKKGMALTALAGPLSNLLMGFVSVFFFYLFNFLNIRMGSSTFLTALALFFFYSASVNVSLAVFNLLPIPPLDGSRILGGILSDEAYNKFFQYERYIMLGVMLLLFTGILNVPLSFLNNLMMKFISIIPKAIFSLFI